MSNNTNKYFPAHLELREVGNGKWELLEDYIFNDTEEGSIVVPKGFISDLYSIPKPLRFIVSKVQNSNGPAVVHDWLYCSKYFGESGRRRADKVLHRAMKLHWSPVKFRDRSKIMLGLRIGGWYSYHYIHNHGPIALQEPHHHH